MTNHQFKQICVIFNHAKKRHVVERYCEQVQVRMPESQIEIIETDDLPTGLQKAKEVHANGVDLLVAAGGDGTLLSVANAAAESTTPITILPLGTSNDYAKVLGIHSLEDAVAATCEGDLKTVDAVRCRFINDDGTPQQLIFCSTAGVGLFAHILHLEKYAISQRLKQLLSDGAWPLMAAVSIFTRRAVSTQIEVQGDNNHTVFTTEMNMCELSKVPRAGGFLFTPDAAIDTGYLDSWIVHDASKPKVITVLLKAVANNAAHVQDPHVYCFSEQPEANDFGQSHLTQMTVTPETPMMVHLNGDTVGQSPATFEILPKALQVLGYSRKINISTR